MDARTWLYIGLGCLGLGLGLLLVWKRISSHPDALVRMGVIVSIIGLFISLSAGIADATRRPPTHPDTSKPTAATSKPEATTTTTAEEQYPGFKALPGDSPKKESGVPHMETVCHDLGRPADAWVQGQTAPHSIEGRILRAHGQAYNWTCGGPISSNNPKITRDEISETCRRHGDGQAAYTWDPHYAYSWYCD